MTLQVERVGDFGVRGQKSLRRRLRFEFEHLLLAPSDREMRVFSAVVFSQSAWSVAIFQAEHAQCRTIRRQAIGAVSWLTSTARRASVSITSRKLKYIAKVQSELEVEPDGVPNNVSRKAVSRERKLRHLGLLGPKTGQRPLGFRQHLARRLPLRKPTKCATVSIAMRSVERGAASALAPMRNSNVEWRDMITLRVAKEEFGWAVQAEQGMKMPFRSRELAVREAVALANGLRAHGQRTEVKVDEAAVADHSFSKRSFSVVTG